MDCNTVMKKLKVSAPALSLLPVDVITNIAFSIPVAADLFAFLEALRPYNLLGPLEHLYQNIWARKQRLNGVSTISQPRRRSHGFKCNSLSSGKEILSRLKHLTTLKVYDEHPFSMLAEALDDYHQAWDDIFQFVEESHQLTELQASPDSHAMSSSNLVNLIAWFRRQPVRVLKCMTSTCGRIDKSLKQSFYEAIFNCPTLDKLILTTCDFEGLDFSRFRFSMRSLQVGYCRGGSDYIDSLASRLENYNLTHLDIYASHDVSIDSVKSLVRDLPYTPIKHLALKGLPFNSNDLSKLAQLCKNSPVESLSLHAFQSSFSFVKSLATAIQNNKTIHDLKVLLPGITVEEIRLLIQSVCHPSRRLKRKQPKLTIPGNNMEKLLIKSLMDFAADCGGEFKNGPNLM
ncbi:hypothetical protein LEN26_011583 [Aphanomyces euteiches]|nr:hypothetical protein AeMF1_017342 [Aphanomyces euteiches]KAH9119547.1 hypothetical protein LEN26_011583 [Aphanomyces euteiches]